MDKPPLYLLYFVGCVSYTVSYALDLAEFGGASFESLPMYEVAPFPQPLI